MFPISPIMLNKLYPRRTYKFISFQSSFYRCSVPFLHLFCSFSKCCLYILNYIILQAPKSLYCKYHISYMHLPVVEARPLSRQVTFSTILHMAQKLCMISFNHVLCCATSTLLNHTALTTTSVLKPMESLGITVIEIFPVASLQFQLLWSYSKSIGCSIHLISTNFVHNF